MGAKTPPQLLIQACFFSHNKAHSGAGLYLHFESDTKGNVVSVTKSNFTDNNSTAGGGMAIGMGRIDGVGNFVAVNETEFVANEARYGGGVVIFTLHGDRTANGDMKLIKFHMCLWSHNRALYSPAVDMMAFRVDQFNMGYLPTPQFTECKFVFNTLQKVDKNGTFHRFSGVFVIAAMTVYFGGKITFIDNRYTALKLIPGRAHLMEGTEMYFGSNVGSEGGGVAMYGASSLVGNKNCHLHFDNNSATSVGGGIVYVPNEQREFFEGKSCFLQYAGIERTLKERNLTFLFTRNSARYGGSSIYATSFYSCFFACHSDLTRYKLSDFLDCIGIFKFEDGPNNSTALRSRGINFNYKGSSPLYILPGQLVTIPISLGDEFGQKSQNVLIVELEGSNKSSAIFTQNVTRVYGTPQENGSLLFRTEDSFRSSYYTMPITFLKCPPGFYFDHKAKSCNCSADNSRYAYEPIVKCNYTTFHALILRGYWAGTCDDACTDGTRLYVSSHPKATSFLQEYMNLTAKYTPFRELPQTMNELNAFMCGEERRGVLCGRCQVNRSVYYHSRTYTCGPKKLCRLGSLFYLLSEIIPVLITFSIILHYDLSFQSGCLNGLVLYCQVVDIAVIKLSTDASNATTELVFRYLQYGYRLFYDVFSLEFFTIEPLSFCPWTGAKLLDVIAFKYITTGFALLLVLLLYRIMNSRHYKCCGRRSKIQRPVTKGLSAFLVLCYSQCAKITFQILSKEVIVGNDGSPDIPVTAYGGLPYFHSQHLIYAVPALICLLTVVFLPLLYLLIIPLMLQLLDLCGLSEHAIVTALLRGLYQQRLMPLIDTFQSNFKPKLKFLAGAYFLYRIAILAVLTFSKNETQFRALLGIVFLVMLGLHAIAQPYKRQRNNVVDGLLFLNLGLIAGIKMLASSPSKSLFISPVQMSLVISPVLLPTCRYFCLVLHKKFRRRKNMVSYEEIRDRDAPPEDAEVFEGQDFSERRIGYQSHSLDSY
jgi:hypothetical protein